MQFVRSSQRFLHARPVALAVGIAVLTVTAAVPSTLAQSSSVPTSEQLRQEIRELRSPEVFHNAENHEVGRASRTRDEPGLVQSTAAATKTVSVDCNKNQSIQKALETKADDLVIEIEGLCVEDVEISRDRVTLVGQDPSLDGIRATTASTDPRQSALRIRNARRIRIENLRFEGSSWDGIRIKNSIDSIELANVTMTANGVRGLTLIDAAATVTDAFITGNGDPVEGTGGGVYSFGSSILVCERCTVADNPGPSLGVAAIVDQGEATFRDSSLSGRTGLRTAGSGQAFVEESSIAALTALLSTGSSSIVTVASDTQGRILSADASQLQLIGSTHTAATPTIAFDDSYLFVSGSIDAPLTLIDFSRARLVNGADVPQVACIDASQAVCSFGSVVGTSSCGGCPVP